MIPVHMYTNAENVVKIGPVFADIFGGICQFLSTFFPGAAKILVFTLVISGVTGPKFT